MKRISLCALLFGNYPGLARRLLTSIADNLPEGEEHIQDIRLAVNNVSTETWDFVDRWIHDVHRRFGVRIIRYLTRQNRYKYPLMRRMVLGDPEPPAEFVTWFDDDSYFDELQSGWWGRMLQMAERHAMLGQMWSLAVQGEQWAWIIQQPWYNPGVGKPPKRKGRPSFRYCQGAWWVIRSDVLRKYDWPCLELKHCGGDSMLGELLRHRGLTIGEFDEGVRINANEKGQHSKAGRRGFEEPVLAKHFCGGKMDLSHQDFDLERDVLPDMLPD